jgi:hypothetical protein
MKYTGLILENDPHAEIDRLLEPLANTGRVMRYTQAVPLEALLTWLATYIPTDVQVTPDSPALRIRHVVKEGHHYYLLFNEQGVPLDFRLKLSVSGAWQFFDPCSGSVSTYGEGGIIHLDGYELKILIAAVL